MGLMSWLRGGRATGDASSPAVVDAPRPMGRDRVDVSRLAPVQRSVTAQDLVIDPGGFQAALTTRRETALGTPLGHLVSPDAPAGLVRGVALAAPGVALAAPGSPAPAVQRAVEMPLRMPGRSAPVAVQRHYGEDAPSLTSAGNSSAVAGLPVRQLVGEQPLVQQAEHVEHPAMGAESGGEALPGAAAVQRTVGSPPARPPRRTPGLGAPLPGLPPTAQRRAVRSSSPQLPSLRPPLVQRDAAPDAPVDDPAVPADGGTPAAPEVQEPSEPSETAEPLAPLLGDAPSVGVMSGGDPGGESMVAPASTDRTVPVQRSAADSAPTPVPPNTPVPPPAVGPTAPLLGERPLSLRAASAPDDAGPSAAAAVQRASEGGGGVQRMPSEPGGPPLSVIQPSAVPVRWTAPAPGAPAGPPAALLQREVSPVPRHTGGAPPVPGPAARTGGRATYPTAGSAAVAAGVAQRMADGSVVFAAAPLHGTSRPVVQRDAEIAEEPPPLPEPEPPPVTDSGAEEGPGPEGGPSGDVSAGPETRTGAPLGQGAPPVTDELVRALYGPLSRLLKADLRLERERAGFLINTRH